MSEVKSVRAKFVCNSVEDFGSNKRAKLSAVYGTEGENKDFTQYTPSGYLEIQIESSAPASSFFVPGKTLYLDFTEAPNA